MEKEILSQLISEALSMRKHSYAPYSHFAVGAALLTEGGRIYTGCNIENAAFGASVCAERTAIFKAVSEGERSLRAIVIAGAPQGQDPAEICPPCGTCRQVMKEFAGPDFKVILAVSEEEYKIFDMEEILPLGFGLPADEKQAE